MIGVVAGQIVTPTGCAITLTNAGLDALLGLAGLAPMTVVGQTVSVTGDGTVRMACGQARPASL